MRVLSSCDDALAEEVTDLRLLGEQLRSLFTGNSTTEAPADDGVQSRPERLGRFEIVRELGRGGCGVVFLARDPLLDRLVAVKVPRADLAFTEDTRRRFRREARAAAGLDHPNIVPLHEAGEIGPICFLVSAYCPGPTLADWLRDRVEPVPFADAAALIATLADAVAHAHSLGVVHRDLKPANVLLVGDARSQLTCPRITDFGLAKVVQEELSAVQTRSGVILGTAAYMAPEQGQAKSVGPTADIYSLGAMLYQCLTGRVPFAGEHDLDTLLQAQQHEPLSPARLRPRLPLDLDTICLKCLQKEPSRRYAAARLLADDLRRYLSGQPILARRIGSLQRLWRWSRRRPALATACVLGLLSAFALAGLALQVDIAARAAAAAELLRGEQHQRQLALEEAQRQRSRAEQTNARLALERGLGLCEQNEAPRGLLWLARGLALAPPEADDLRRAARRNLADWRPRVHGLRGGYRHRGPVTQFAVRPDGKVLASAGGDGQIILWDIAADRPAANSIKYLDILRALAWSPKGDRLVSGCDNDSACVWDAATGRLVWDFRHNGPVFACAVNPAGTLLATATLHDVRLWRLDTGTAQGQAVAVGGFPDSLAFSPDGQLLALGGRDGKTRLLETATGKVRLCETAQVEEVCAVKFRRDGRALATCSFDGTACIHDPHSGRTLARLVHTETVHAAAFSPDGQWLATACEDAAVRLWSVATPSAAPKVMMHRDGVLDVAFSPDGQTLASAGRAGAARLWQVATARPLGSALLHRDAVKQVAFAGGRLLTGSEDGEVRSWEPSGGREPGVPLAHGGAVSAAAFSPNGQLGLTGSWDRKARWWDEAGNQLGEAALPGRVRCVAWAADGRSAAAAGHGGLKLIDIVQQSSRTLLDHPALVLAVAFSPDGTRLLSGSSGGAAQFWEVASGRSIGSAVLCQGDVLAVAFSPDGRLAAVGSRHGELWFLDGRTGQKLHEQFARGREFAAITGLSFGRAGQVLAVASADGLVRLVDVARRAPFGETLRHNGRVLALSFDPMGDRLASAAADGLARIWRLEGERATQLGRPLEHASAVTALAFNSDGRHLATAAMDGTCRVWEAIAGPNNETYENAGAIAFGSPLLSVALSPDGRRVLVGCRDGTARLWALPPPTTESAEEVERATQLLTGLELDPDGLVRVLPVEAWLKRAGR